MKASFLGVAAPDLRAAGPKSGVRKPAWAERTIQNGKHAAGWIVAGDFVGPDEWQLHASDAVSGTLGVGKRLESLYRRRLPGDAGSDHYCYCSEKLDSAGARTCARCVDSSVRRICLGVWGDHVWAKRQRHWDLAGQHAGARDQFGFGFAASDAPAVATEIVFRDRQDDCRGGGH